MKKTVAVLLFALVSTTWVVAQQSVALTENWQLWRNGMELFDKQQYGNAKKEFEKIVTEIDDPYNEISINAQYYAARCATQLFHKDAGLLMADFVRQHPESEHVKSAWFELGQYNYIKKKWGKVIEYFTKVETFEIPTDQRDEYYFKLGYAYFQKKEFEKASNAFYAITDTKSNYYGASRYYYGHINYLQQNYQTALLEFQKLQDDETFGGVVPYYISQIYYVQKKNDKLIEYATPLLDKAVKSRRAEIAKLIGEAWYQKGNFDKSLPFLVRHQKESRSLSRDDRYQLAYAYYKNKRYQEAVDQFSLLTYTDDSLAQNSLYHLADAYLNLDEKQYARNAFKSASQLDFDPQIQEDALFQFAKLAYEMSFDPYNRSIKAFEEYIEKYPNSARKDEATTYMVNAYMSSKNYKSALASLEKIASQNSETKTIYQNVAYNRGLELYELGRHDEAISTLALSRKYPMDPKISTLSYYWEGDAHYRQKNYDEAIKAYQTFIFEPGAILTKQFQDAHYDIAYAYRAKENLEDAIIWYRKFIGYEKSSDVTKKSDALLRLGDAYLLKRDYQLAIDFYKQAGAISKTDADYALYQQALSSGLNGELQTKADLLQKLEKDFPKSAYYLKTQYDLGRTYINLNKPEFALGYFDKILNDKRARNSILRKNALLSKGWLFYNKSDNDKAMPMFKQVVDEYPNYEDSQEALVGIRKIYIEWNKVPEFQSYVEGLAFVDISKSELDSTTYEAAELAYYDGRCAQAIPSFEKYLEQFDKPNFAINANFYLGECYEGVPDFEKALNAYNYIIAQPTNKFTETSLIRAARINFNQDEYEAAGFKFKKLLELTSEPDLMEEARTGLMVTSYSTENYEEAAKYASIVIAMTSDQELLDEAYFIKGKSSFEEGQANVAQEALAQVALNRPSDRSSEAQYLLARISYIMAEYDTTEQMVFALINQPAVSEYWVANALLLLSDVYIGKEDYFQAKATIQSVIENYDGEELLAVANDKLQQLIEKENQAQQQQEQVEEEEDEIELNLDDEIEELFELEEDEE